MDGDTVCRGNVLASRGDYEGAREAYLASAVAFQGASGAGGPYVSIFTSLAQSRIHSIM